MNYASGSVDGLTQSTNTQAGWAGEGFSVAGLSYVERSYRACKDDGVAYTGGDLCWNGYAPVSIVLNGQSTQLMDTGTGWKAENDSLGWKVERLTDRPNNGAYGGEYFRVSTMDGTAYWFGSRDRAAYGGVQRVDVFGNDVNEPCHFSATFATNHCWQAYKWNLDYVQDRFGNTMVYQWQVYEGNYGLNRNAAAVTYDITSTLKSIDFGANTAVAGGPVAQIEFTAGFRCFYAGCEYQTNDPSIWMDTPWDQRCDTWATSCPGLYSPTFWTLYRLDQVTSKVWDTTLNSGAGGWSWVDFIAPSYSFPPTGDYVAPYGTDDTSPSLGLWKIWLKNAPPIDVISTRLTNRVFWGDDLGRAPMTHWRVSELRSGTGQTTKVTYSPEECTRTNVYDGASDHNPRRCFPQWEVDQYRWYHKYVVTDVTVDDTVGGSPQQRWHYDYSTTAASSTNGAEWASALWHYDNAWLIPATRRAFSQWRGYTNVKTTHGNTDGTGPQQVSEDIFYRGMNGDRTTTGGFGTRNVTIDDSWDHTIVDHEAMQGRLRRTMTFDGRTGPWTSATRHLPTIVQTGGQYMGGGTPDLKAWRALETTTITQTVMAGPTYRLTQVDTTYDPSYPIPTLVKDHGDTSDPAIGTSDDKCTLTSYVTPDVAKYLVNFPKQTLTTSCATTLTAADYLGGTQYFYDASTTLGALGVGANAKAALTKALELKSSSAAPPNSTDWIQGGRSTYDARGRVLDSFDGLDRKTTTTYSPALAGPTSSQTVTTPAPSGTGSGFTTVTAFDLRFGTPTVITDPNGRITRAEYDGAGRLSKVWKNNRAPGDTTGITPDLQYTYVLRDNGPNYVSTKSLTSAGGQLESFVVFDGTLRPRRTETVAAMGSGRTIADTLYDSVGNKSQTRTFYNVQSINPNLDAYYDKDVASQERYVYDNLGRTTREQVWTGNGVASSLKWETLYTYDGDKTKTVQPPTGGIATTTIFSAQGNILELRQHLAGLPSAAVDVTTKYAYDRLGQLTTVTDHAGKQWKYEYDQLNRRVKTTDPDAGISTTAYDNAGQVTETVDGNNIKLVYKYDLLGRQTELRETSTTGNLRAAWTFDPLGAKGKLSTATRHDTGGAYVTTVDVYDDGYRPKQTTHTIPGFAAGGNPLAYTVQNTYNANGSVATLTRPAVNGLPAEKLTYGYNTAGQPSTMTGDTGQTYVNSTEYHYDGLLYRQYLGNTGTRFRRTTDFDPATRRLTRIWNGVEDSPGGFQVPYDYSYAYDNAGNVTSIAGNVHGFADQKECFTHDHLQRLTEAWTQTTGTCTTPQSTGAEPYHLQWTLDKQGNRKTQNDFTTLSTYTVGGVDSCGGAAKPHSVTSITGPGAPTRTFCYDNAGNTTRRATETGAVQNLLWDKENRLQSVTQGSSTWTNIYDADGNRLIAKSPGSDTLYLPDGTEIKKIGTLLEGTRYYQHNGNTIGFRVGATLTWLSADHHGTPQLQLSATNPVGSFHRRLLRPYGEARGSQPNYVGTKGFVGGVSDTTGLTHLGAREYDPTLGRFLSIDPEIDLTDPQTLHGYLYANNSPITFTDPSGRSWGSFGKGLLNGWAQVNTDPILFLNEIVDAQAQVISATVLGNQDPTVTMLGYSIWAADEAIDVLASPITTLIDGWNEGVATYNAAQAGDWEGAGEHGYIAAADAAYTAMFVFGEASAFRGCHSFAPETQVLMADGTTKPIADIAVGEQVLATDPETDQTASQQVTALHINRDWDLADVTINNEETGQETTIRTTWTHPFWNAADGRWTDAYDLKPGTRLRQSNGDELLVVTSVQLRIGNDAMRDLTVADFHTYYVAAGATEVLVHNCNRGGMAFTDAERQAVYDRNAAANGGALVCEYCGSPVVRRESRSGQPGRPDDAQIDHVDPMCRGGCGGAHNGAVACRRCNRDKSTATVPDWDDRLRAFLEEDFGV